MCGRASVVLRCADVATITGRDAAALPAAYVPRANTGPGAVVPVFVAPAAGGTAVLDVVPAVWGLPRHGGGGGLLINARSESAASTATWARLLARGAAGRGCVAVQGWFEWKRDTRQPYFVHGGGSGAGGGGNGGDSGGSGSGGGGGGSGGGGGGGGGSVPPFPLIALAALVDAAASPPRFAIVTTAPPPSLAWLHDRAPAVLGPASRANPALAAWLRGDAATAALAPYGGALAWHPVTRAVGSTQYQGADVTRDARRGGLAAAWARAAVKTEPAAASSDDAAALPKAAVKKKGGDTGAPAASLPSSPFGKKKRPPSAGGQASLDSFFERKKRRECE